MRDACEEHCRENLQTQQPDNVDLYKRSTATMNPMFCGTFGQAVITISMRLRIINGKVVKIRQAPREPQDF